MRLGLLLLATTCCWGQKLPFTAEAMMKMGRISEPRLSPDGNTVAFTLERPDVENNSRPKQIYVVPLSGGAPVQLTKEGSNQRPRWLPDSRRVVFLSDRAGSKQIWIMNADGTDPKQITAAPGEADGVIVSPDGAKLLFTSDVFPDCPDEPCNKSRAEQQKTAKIHPRVYNSLLYRHWNAWQTGTRKHLLIIPTAGGPGKDLTPGNSDVPPFSLGGGDDYSFSPDGTEITYVANTDKVSATSTNSDLFTIPVGGGEPKRITTGLGADNSPRYSPDGKYIAFRSQVRAGYESDRWWLMTLERATGHTASLLDTLDRSVEEITWSPDSSKLFFTVEDRGRVQVQMIGVSGGATRAVVSGNSHVSDVQFSPDGKTMVYAEGSGEHPTELYRAVSGGGAAVPLTKTNAELLAQYELPQLEEFWVKAPDESRVHSFLLKPPAFQTGKKYPVLFLVHGGPQSAWGESWTFRWNAQVFAGAGYVVVMPNPRGSTGYGQKFTDEINADWGGKPYDDIMAVVDHVAKLAYTDSERMGAAGASYGGYMVGWLLAHTDRFKALVAHAGLYDTRSAAAATEELWFPLWEFKSMPWDNPDLYTRMSPISYVRDFKTPTLLTHGELDYRVPVEQAYQLFTALQLEKIPSKLILFPDEGHWILKPQNSLFWYRNVLDWLSLYLQKTAPAKQSG